MKRIPMVPADYQSAGQGYIPFDDRRVVVVIRHKIWCMTLPILFGRYKAFCNPNYEGDNSRSHDSGSEINVLTCIKGIDPEIGAHLSRDEQMQLLQFFVSSMNFLKSICYIKDRPFMREAIADLQAAVNHLVQSPHHYGQSKWASQQMVEKFLKSFLHAKGCLPIPKTHVLRTLATRAKNCGLDGLAPQSLEDIACKAGVRYGEIPVTGVEAVRAHHASLSICAVIAPHIPQA